MAAESVTVDSKVEALVAQHMRDSSANEEDEDALFASLRS